MGNLKLKGRAIQCTCGSKDGWDNFDATDTSKGTAVCWNCEVTVPIEIEVPAFYGKAFDNGEGGIYIEQVGRRFSSHKEMESWAASEGLEAVSPSSSRWKGLKDNSKQHADSEAKAEGFKGSDDRMHSMVDNHRDFVATARQAKIDDYHAEHGEEARQTVDEAFGPLPS